MERLPANVRNILYRTHLVQTEIDAEIIAFVLSKNIESRNTIGNITRELTREWYKEFKEELDSHWELTSEVFNLERFHELSYHTLRIIKVKATPLNFIGFLSMTFMLFLTFMGVGIMSIIWFAVFFFLYDGEDGVRREISNIAIILKYMR